MSRERHPLAGKTVRLEIRAAARHQLLETGAVFRVEDWCVNAFGKSWMDAEGNPAALGYALRAGCGGLPTDNEVVYGHIEGLGYLVHVSELREVSA